ncbi:hypothetical protein AAVH_10285 [Aphelenchoides avenae]|nr:hypothetical protein AAVH_10285 [Aphelenchus avenae]
MNPTTSKPSAEWSPGRLNVKDLAKKFESCTGRPPPPPLKPKPRLSGRGRFTPGRDFNASQTAPINASSLRRPSFKGSFGTAAVQRNKNPPVFRKKSSLTRKSNSATNIFIDEDGTTTISMGYFKRKGSLRKMPKSHSDEPISAYLTPMALSVEIPPGDTSSLRRPNSRTRNANFVSAWLLTSIASSASTSSDATMSSATATLPPLPRTIASSSTSGLPATKPKPPPKPPKPPRAVVAAAAALSPSNRSQEGVGSKDNGANSEDANGNTLSAPSVFTRRNSSRRITKPRPQIKPPAPTEALRTPTASSSLTCSSAPDSLAQEPDADSATAAIADDDASCKTDAPTSSSRTSRRKIVRKPSMRPPPPPPANATGEAAGSPATTASTAANGDGRDDRKRADSVISRASSPGIYQTLSSPDTPPPADPVAGFSQGDENAGCENVSKFTMVRRWPEAELPKLPSMPPPSPPKLSPTSSEGRSMKESIEADEKFDDLYEEIEQAFNASAKIYSSSSGAGATQEPKQSADEKGVQDESRPTSSGYTPKFQKKQYRRISPPDFYRCSSMNSVSPPTNRSSAFNTATRRSHEYAMDAGADSDDELKRDPSPLFTRTLGRRGAKKFLASLGHGTINLHSFGRSFADDSMAQSSSSSKAAARSNSGRFVTWTSGKRNSARKRPTSTAIEFEKLLRIKSEIQLNLTKKMDRFKQKVSSTNAANASVAAVPLRYGAASDQLRRERSNSTFYMTADVTGFAAATASPVNSMDERIYGDDWSTDSDSSDDEPSFSRSDPAPLGACVKNSRSFDNYSAYYCSADRPDASSVGHRHRSEGPANRYGIDQDRSGRKYARQSLWHAD